MTSSAVGALRPSHASASSGTGRLRAATASFWWALRSGRTLRSLALLACLWLLPAAAWIILLPQPAWAALPFLTAMAWMLWLLVCWAMFVFNVLLQNHPLVAATLPRQVAALRGALLIGAAIAIGLSSASVALAGGSAWITAGAAAIVSAVFACSLRWPALWLVVIVASWGLPLAGMDGGFAAILALWRQHPAAVSLLWLLLAALALPTLVMRGGARHQRAHARLQAVGAAMKGQPPEAAGRSGGHEAGQATGGGLGLGAGGVAGAGWAWQLRVNRGLYSRWMRRLLARPDGQVHARLALGLGPPLHWTSTLSGVITMLVLAGLVMTALAAFPAWETGRAITGGMMVGVAVAGPAYAMQYPATMWATRREQALLRLLPGAPSGPALGRWLAQRMAAQYLGAVALHGLALVLLDRLYTMPPMWEQMRGAAFCSLALSPLLALTLWRDWSRGRAPAGLAQVGVMLAILAVGAGAFVWTTVMERAWWELAGSLLALSLPLWLWRWRLVCRAPAPWPVGRNA